MPGGRSLPNLRLQAFFDLGEDGWKDEIDLAFLKLSVLTQGVFLSKEATTPTSPTEGDVYIFDETHPTDANAIAVYDDATWKYITPQEGWLLYNQDQDYYEKFDGTVWDQLETGGAAGPKDWELLIAVGGETTALTTGVAKVTWRQPRAVTLTEVRASVTTAPTGANIIVDINEGGASILSTKLSIDTSEKTSTTAATPAVISDSAIADDAEMTIDIDQIGSTVAGAGLKVLMKGTYTP